MGRRNQRPIPNDDYSDPDERDFVADEFAVRYGVEGMMNLARSKAARDRWKRDRLQLINQLDADLESGRIARALQRELRAAFQELEDDESISRRQQELIGTLKKLTTGDTSMDLSNSTDLTNSSDLTNAASVPYVGVTQTRHEPTTTTHEHDHAAHGHADHDDGIHSHRHDHDGDASHDHVHVHGNLVAGRSPQEGEMAGSVNTYGLLNSAEVGPVARMRLKQQQQAAQERRR